MLGYVKLEKYQKKLKAEEKVAQSTRPGNSTPPHTQAPPTPTPVPTFGMCCVSSVPGLCVFQTWCQVVTSSFDVEILLIVCAPVSLLSPQKGRCRGAIRHRFQAPRAC